MAAAVGQWDFIMMDMQPQYCTYNTLQLQLHHWPVAHLSAADAAGGVCPVHGAGIFNGFHPHPLSVSRRQRQ